MNAPHPLRPSARLRRRLGRGVNDEGGIITGWLLKLIVVFGLLGIVLFDGISIATTHVNTADQASYAAREASSVWLGTRNLQMAYDKATQRAMEANAANLVDAKTFRVDTDGRVHATVTREATTLIVFHIGAIKHWADVRGKGTGLDVG